MDNKFEITIYTKSYTPESNCFGATITHQGPDPDKEPKFMSFEGNDFHYKDGKMGRRRALDEFMRALSHTIRYAAYPDDTMRYEQVETPEGNKYVPRGYPDAPIGSKENIPNGEVEE